MDFFAHAGDGADEIVGLLDVDEGKNVADAHDNCKDASEGAADGFGALAEEKCEEIIEEEQTEGGADEAELPPLEDVELTERINEEAGSHELGEE